MKDLIERLREGGARDCCSQRNDAADAIEKLEAENAQLKAEFAEAKSAFDRLTPHAEAIIAERDALKAELAAMRDQKPVGEVYTMEALASGGYVRHHASLTKSLPAGTKLYAAPIADIEARWIPVTERLPKAYDEVMVWPHPSNNSMTADINTIGTWRYGEYELNFGWTENVCEVTHWMPLPAAPGANHG